TGHAETVQVEYDPNQISYQELLNLFWDMHDPTQLNRQGFDIGNQYRSVIFYHSKEQQELAIKSKAEIEALGKYKHAIMTEIIPATTFYRAEEYHQRYHEKHGG